jgi:hypothetical protein
MLIYARLETPNYTFDVLAATREDAERKLRDAWGRHQRQTGAEMPWIELLDSVSYREMQINVAYRDGNVLP